MKKRKKGMSIAEICIVLAVISIAGLMVTSFTVMVGTRSSVSAARLEVMQDLEMAETVLEGWVDNMTGQDAVFVAEEGRLKAVKDTVDYAVTLEDGLLMAPVPAGAPYRVALETVTAIAVEAKHNGPDTIFFCTLTYTDPQGGEEPQTYTFCINSRIGEKV
ncbi:MAG: hypothetical protein IKB80_06410 [Oscillospiraceae bacterium]|nr:hypothetical protein [Oscillospiraceae bacterium]